MPTTDICTELRGQLDKVLEGRRLLDHPFYRRWEAGELSREELGAYAGQYRHFEEYLLHFLHDLAASLPEGNARSLVESNLADERNRPAPHLSLFDAFAAACGVEGNVPAAAATDALVATYRDALDEGPATALGVLAAYEVQAAGIAASKADGLRRQYGVSAEGTAFWDVHAEIDLDHRDWVVAAMDEVASGSDAGELITAFRRGADAWWNFLDEREACRPELQPA